MNFHQHYTQEELHQAATGLLSLDSASLMEYTSDLSAMIESVGSISISHEQISSSSASFLKPPPLHAFPSTSSISRISTQPHEQISSSSSSFLKTPSLQAYPSTSSISRITLQNEQISSSSFPRPPHLQPYTSTSSISRLTPPLPNTDASLYSISTAMDTSVVPEVEVSNLSVLEKRLDQCQESKQQQMSDVHLILQTTGVYDEAFTPQRDQFLQDFLRVIPYAKPLWDKGCPLPGHMSMEHWHAQAWHLASGRASTLTVSQQAALSMAGFPWNFRPLIEDDEIFAYHETPTYKLDKTAPIVPNGLEIALATDVLTECGMDVTDGKNEKEVLSFHFIVAYRMRHGDFRISKKHHPVVGKHVENLRNQDIKNEEYKCALNKIHFNWEARESVWQKHLSELRAFKRKTGSTVVPKRAGSLGVWVCKQREMKRKFDKARREGKRIPDEEKKCNKIEQLQEIDFVWDPKNTTT